MLGESNCQKAANPDQPRQSIWKNASVNTRVFALENNRNVRESTAMSANRALDFRAKFYRLKACQAYHGCFI